MELRGAHWLGARRLVGLGSPVAGEGLPRMVSVTGMQLGTGAGRGQGGGAGRPRAGPDSKLRTAGDLLAQSHLLQFLGLPPSLANEACGL